MTEKQFSQMALASLRSLSVQGVSVTRKFETDQFVCKVTFVVNAEDEIGVFSALHTVLAGVTEHLMRKHSTRNNT